MYRFFSLTGVIKIKTRTQRLNYLRKLYKTIENHRTQSSYESNLTTKLFVVSKTFRRSKKYLFKNFKEFIL